MQTIDNELLKYLNIYFNTLSRLGYMSYSEVDKLIVALFLGEVVEGLFGELISEEDFKSITKAFYCLYGSSCMLPYPKLNKGTAFFSGFSSPLLRITEDYVLKGTELSDLRIME